MSDFKRETPILTAAKEFSDEEFRRFTEDISIKYDFVHCKFRNVFFTNWNEISILNDCEFYNCTFYQFNRISRSDIDTNNSKFYNCRFNLSDFSKSHFSSVEIHSCEFIDTNLSNSNFVLSTIENTVFKSRSNLSSINFSGAKMDNVTVSDCIIKAPPKGLSRESITINGAATNEIELNRNKLLDALKIEPLKQLNPIQSEVIEPTHIDKLQTIAEYEQKLNVSPEERIVEMNYSTAHWQTKDGIKPDQAEALYDFITNQQYIQIDDANRMRSNVGKPPLIADEYYHNQKNMAYASRFDFGSENSINIESINTALKEVSFEYVLSKMTKDQLDLFTDYYETSIDFSDDSKVNLSYEDKQLYDSIIKLRKNELSIDKVVDTITNNFERTAQSFTSQDDFIAAVQEGNEKNGVGEFSGEKISRFGLENKSAETHEIGNITTSKALTKEEFEKLTSEMKEIAKTYTENPDLFTEFMAFKAQFYQYSPTNTMLIHLQNPYATFVASYTKWKEMGYSVKKGEHHIKISRPIEISKFPKEICGKKVWTDIKYASPDEKAKIANDELEIRKTTKFIPHQVFDISQTDCPVNDYPKIYNMGHPDIEQKQLYECVKEFAKASGFTVSEEDLSSISLQGYYNKTDDSIHINSLLEDSKRLEIMCHELAHGVLHKTSTQPTEIKEFEAECFSAMLKRKMGFPVSDESKRYIRTNYKKAIIKNPKFECGKTLERLSKAFNHVSKGIEDTISNMGFSHERDFAYTLAQATSKAVDVSQISENFMQAL